MRKIYWHDFVRWPHEQKDKYYFLVDVRNNVTLYEKGNKVEEKKYKTALSKKTNE